MAAAEIAQALLILNTESTGQVMTTVNTSKCSTATELTKVRREEKPLPCCLQWEEPSEMRCEKARDRHTLWVSKAFVPGSTAQVSQNWCLKICRLNTKKNGNIATDFSTKKSSL